MKDSLSRKELIGWIGSFSFAICGLPQAVRSTIDGHSNGLEWGFLLLWLIGELGTIYYIWDDRKRLAPLLFNYCLNIVFLWVVIFYKLFPRM
jgi:hypothetical protein